MGEQSYEELMDAGFEEVIEIIKDEPTPEMAPRLEKKVPDTPKNEVAPYIVVDNNEIMQKMENTNALMAEAMGKLVNAMQDKPREMDLEIKRGSNGLMKGVKVKLTY